MNLLERPRHVVATRWLAGLGLNLLPLLASAQILVEGFEYGTDDDLLAAWQPTANAVVSSSAAVASTAAGQRSMRVEFSFPSGAWVTEAVKGVDLAELVSLGPEQYVTFRIQGDPAFAASDFRNLYLYAYDDQGNFGRWGAPTPTTSTWQVRNHSAATLEQPWDSPGLPDLGRIIRFAFFQYGSEAALPAYTAAIGIDDLQIRDTPLTETPVATTPVLEAFEYATAADLTAAWKGSAQAVVSLSDNVAPRSPGRTSMRVEFQFPSIEWATESASGPVLPAPVSLGSSQYLTFRVKGDPAFAAADYRELFLYVYDDAGNFGRWGAPVPTTADWQIRNHTAATLQKPWDSPGLPNLGRITKIAFFQYGSQAALPAYTASIQLDDVVVRDTPLVETELPGETVIEGFEYASSEDLAAAWIGSPNAVVSGSDSVAPKSTGRQSMSVQFNFPSSAWATEFVKSQVRTQAVAVSRTQYLSFRLRGDPAFAGADFRNLYLYAYDDEGRFGRWGGPVPDTADWQIVNYSIGAIEKPWDSPELPNLERLVRFAFYQYGSEAAIEPYTATILIDDLAVRSSPLVEFPAPSAPRTVIDDFEGYASADALQAFYTYQNSPAATATIAAPASPAPQGARVLRLTVDFAAGQYPWGSVRSSMVPPFSIPTNAVVSLRIRGDAGLAAGADGGTSFWLSFYDRSGRGMNFVSTAAPVVSGEWTVLEARFQDFGDHSTVDTGNLVQWRILVQAREGTAESPALTGTFLIDDIQVSTAFAEPPLLTLMRAADGLEGKMSSLTPGKTYQLRASPDFAQWTTVTEITATATTASWAVPQPVGRSFYVLREK